MKKFLIATILVLSCSTASANDVYIPFRSDQRRSPESAKAWKDLVRSLDLHLKKRGHRIEKSVRNARNRGVQLAIRLHTTKTSKIVEVSWVNVQDGLVLLMGNIPLNGSQWDANWMARQILDDARL